MLGNIRISQLLAIVSSLAAFILLIVFSSRVKRMGEDYVLYRDSEESKKLLADAEEKANKDKKKK